MRERESVRAGEGQKERETHHPKQALVSVLSAQSPTQGSNSWTMRSWPEPKSDSQPTEPPRIYFDLPSSSHPILCLTLCSLYNLGYLHFSSGFITNFLLPSEDCGHRKHRCCVLSLNLKSQHLSHCWLSVQASSSWKVTECQGPPLAGMKRHIHWLPGHW